MRAQTDMRRALQAGRAQWPASRPVARQQRIRIRASETAEAPDAAPALPRMADLDAPATQRRVGALVGACTGAALGLSVEPERHFRISRLFPEGLTDPWRFSAAGPAARRAPGDAAAAVAAARALADSDCTAELGPLLDALAGSYAPAACAYSPYTALVLDALSSGVDPFSLARQADAFLNAGASRAASSSSDRAERQPFGAADAGGALRCAPLGVAYAGKSDEELVAAVDTYCLFSHPADDGRDGALAAAAAAAWLAAGGPDSCTPEGLLVRVRQVATSDSMRSKLDVLQRALAALGQLPEITGPGQQRQQGSSSGDGAVTWREFWRSEEWGRVVEAHTRLSDRGFATLGTQAVAVALLALCTNWQRPAQAVVIAASLGGSSSTTAALAGVFAGALHGSGWVPQRWCDALAESPAGREILAGAIDAGLRLGGGRGGAQ